MKTELLSLSKTRDRQHQTLSGWASGSRRFTKSPGDSFNLNPSRCRAFLCSDAELPMLLLASLLITPRAEGNAPGAFVRVNVGLLLCDGKRLQGLLPVCAEEGLQEDFA